jgi:arginyl-tRNA synthetase
MSRDELTRLIEKAITGAVSSGSLPQVEFSGIELERPKKKEHGDWATNAALVIAGGVGLGPREVAEAICAAMPHAPEVVSSVEVAGPGFINFRLSKDHVRDVLFRIAEKGERYGSSGIGGKRKVQVEFVSANPVGPMHVGHGRWAALGDSLSSVLSHAGYDVTREFYINDYGTQIRNFGRSISARYMEALGRPSEFPEGGYAGSYVNEIAGSIVEEHGDLFAGMPEPERVRRFIEMEYPKMLDEIKGTLQRMGVSFDVWFSEMELYRKGEVDQALEALTESGEAYRREGALWLGTSRYGDEKDRVLVRSNGEPTYFASDIAYHRDKMERGFERVIDIWGADHHGYVARMKAAMAAMGYDPDSLEVILGQLVRLYRSGEPVTMSKRTGDIVTLEELVEEVGPDAVRYFFLQRSHDSPLDFDIELAKKESPENPVYYVQYAHARISSILRYAEEEGADLADPGADELALLDSEAEMNLLGKLDELEEVVELCAARRAPHRLTGYAEELAALFHVFYRDCRVVTGNRKLTAARLFLAMGTRQVLRIVLGLIGVSAPERM